MVSSVDVEKLRSKLFRNLPAVELPLPQAPYIMVTTFWDASSGFVQKEGVAYQVDMVGLNLVTILSEKCNSKESSDDYVKRLTAATGWPVVRVRRIVETRHVYEFYEEEASNGE